MYLKIMSQEDKPDHNNSKSFEIIECKSVAFYRDAFTNDPFAIVDDCRYDLTGNAYVMNEAGRTVSAFAYSDVD